MEISDLIWIIPGDKTESYNMEDGKIITRGKTSIQKQHIDVIEKVREEFNLLNPSVHSVEGYAKAFCELGIFTLVNIGKIDDRYAACLFLPEQLTISQIETLQNLRIIFEENFHLAESKFQVGVYTTNTNLNYKLSENCFRDLYIESIINGKKNKNGIELLYQEIEKQKANTRKIK